MKYDWRKEPFMNMMRPDEKDYRKRVREIAIYSNYEVFDPDGDQDAEDNNNNHRSSFSVNGKKDGIDHWYSGYRDQSPIPNIKGKVTLQTIMDLVPVGISPSDIKIRTHIDYGDAGIYGQEISFYYKAHLSAEPEEYKKDMEIWQKLYNEYEIKKAAFDKENNEQQIKELEEKLANLKK